MATLEMKPRIIGRVDQGFSPAERVEMRALGLLDGGGEVIRLPATPAQVPRHVIGAPEVLNEAFDYELPSSFTRGLGVRIESGQQVLWLSGTASIDELGATVHAGDFRAQTWRTYRNLTELLKSAGASWHDVVRTSCYLRDIERDYDDFNRIRTLFFDCLGLDPLPASTGIQARLCRSDLLIEIEAFAVVAGG
jgi:2-iminobutanoate/2-iminopropanoate deaminase